MIGSWYDGDWPVEQPYGCTLYTAEPSVPTSVCASGHFHRGIDIGVPLGTPLKAPAPGITLTQVGYDPTGFGPHYPIMLLPDGTQFLIGHTDSVVAPLGPLQVGAVFAYSGNMGMSTGPHAHFQANASPGDFINTKDPVPYVELGLEDDLDATQAGQLQDVWNALGGTQIASGVSYLPWSQEIKTMLQEVRDALLNDPPDTTANYLAWSRDVTAKLAAIEAKLGA